MTATPPKPRPITPPTSITRSRVAKAFTPVTPPARKEERDTRPPIRPQNQAPITPKDTGGLRASPPARKSATKKASATGGAPQMAVPPANLSASLARKREQAQQENQAPQVKSGSEKPEGTRYNEQLPKDFVPSSPVEAMFYAVFNQEDESGFIDNFPFQLADRAMPSPKG